jgi:nitroreductase
MCAASEHSGEEVTVIHPVVESLMNHRSIRRFQSRPIEEEVVERILTAGTRAATAGNLQLYTLLTIDDPEGIALLKREKVPVMRNTPLVVVSLLDLYRIRRWMEVSDTEPVVMDRAIYFMLGFWDATIALQNVVVAAESLGLGTCYVGSILSFDVYSHFGVPEGVFPAGMVCIGYPDEEPDLSMRLPLDAVVHRNRYQRPSDEQIRAFYREREGVWDTVGEGLKERLAAQDIRSIPQALAVQRFSDQVTSARSTGILANLKRSGFSLTDDR